jgi:hypothetical protein
LLAYVSHAKLPMDNHFLWIFNQLQRYDTSPFEKRNLEALQLALMDDTLLVHRGRYIYMRNGVMWPISFKNISDFAQIPELKEYLRDGTVYLIPTSVLGSSEKAPEPFDVALVGPRAQFHKYAGSSLFLGESCIEE